MKRSTKDSQLGASVIELVIVLVISGVVVTFAASQFGRSRENLARQNIARQFKVLLERARFDSIKRAANTCSAMSRVTIVDATTYTVAIDGNQNGQLDFPGELRTVSLPSSSGVSIVGSGSGLTLPVTIRFNERGHALLTDCVTAPPANIPLLYFCDAGCTAATANAGNSNVLFISPTGTVAMLPGGSTVPTFANPAVTSVASNTTVNPLLAVWESSAPSPTPVASPTPTPTSSPTPTPTPTPSPTPTGTPTPSPTPPTCTAGQRPASAGCTCRSPMWVRNNGKCQ